MSVGAAGEDSGEAFVVLDVEAHWRGSCHFDGSVEVVEAEETGAEVVDLPVSSSVYRAFGQLLPEVF